MAFGHFLGGLATGIRSAQKDDLAREKLRIAKEQFNLLRGDKRAAATESARRWEITEARALRGETRAVAEANLRNKRIEQNIFKGRAEYWDASIKPLIMNTRDSIALGKKEGLAVDEERLDALVTKMARMAQKGAGIGGVDLPTLEDQFRFMVNTRESFSKTFRQTGYDKLADFRQVIRAVGTKDFKDAQKEFERQTALKTIKSMVAEGLPPSDFLPGQIRYYDRLTDDDLLDHGLPTRAAAQAGQVAAAKLDPAAAAKKAGDEVSKVAFGRADKLRDEFVKAAGDFVKVRDSFNTILSVSEKPSAAGDIGLVFAIMKMFDPSSVVRESEFATAANAAGVPDRMRAQWNKLLSGERLADNQRKDFIDTAKRIFAGRERQHKGLVSEFTRLAKGFELDPATVIVDFGSVQTIRFDAQGNRIQ